MTGSTQLSTIRALFADIAGAFGAIVAALCCAGTSLVVAALAAAGLSSIRKDAILWPLMLASLMLALWGYWRGQSVHRSWAPLVVGLIGATSLALGVIVVHGFPAMQMIYGGSILLVAATAWNILARKRRGEDAAF